MIHETALNGCFCNPLSHMHGLCVRFSALQISRQWMNDLYVEKIYSHFRFSKPKHYQSKSKRFVPSIENIEKEMWGFNCMGRPGCFSQYVLKTSAILLKYILLLRMVFSCFFWAKKGDTKLEFLHKLNRDKGDGWARWVTAHPGFGRSVSGARLCPLITTCPLRGRSQTTFTRRGR